MKVLRRTVVRRGVSVEENAFYQTNNQVRTKRTDTYGKTVPNLIDDQTYRYSTLVDSNCLIHSFTADKVPNDYSNHTANNVQIVDEDNSTVTDNVNGDLFIFVHV